MRPKEATFYYYSENSKHILTKKMKPPQHEARTLWTLSLRLVLVSLLLINPTPPAPPFLFIRESLSKLLLHCKHPPMSPSSDCIFPSDSLSGISNAHLLSSSVFCRELGNFSSPASPFLRSVLRYSWRQRTPIVRHLSEAINSCFPSWMDSVEGGAQGTRVPL